MGRFRSLMLAVVMLGLVGIVPRAALSQPASVWEQARQTGVLRVGLIPNRPPYQWENGGKLTGLSIKLGQDLVAALEKELGRTIRIDNVVTSWSTLILDMQSNRVDAFFGLTETEERRKVVDMFGPLYAIPVVAMTRGNSTFGETWEDFNKADATVSVTMGTSDEDAARRNMPKARVNGLKSAGDAILDVMSGKSQAFITSLLIGAPLMQKNPALSKMIILRPAYSLPSGGASRRDHDGKFAAFAQKWAQGYREGGDARRAVIESVRESGFDLIKLVGDVEF